MNKECTVTFRVEHDLRDEFNAATKFSHRPAAQVLREFMYAYVNRFRRNAPSISEEERSRRLDAFNYARASVALEGFNIDSAEEQRARRFINGEIDMQEFLAG